MKNTDNKYLKYLKEVTENQLSILEHGDLDTRNLQCICTLQNRILNSLVEICHSQQYMINEIKKSKITRPFTEEELEDIRDTIKFVVEQYMYDEDDLPANLYEWKCCFQEYSSLLGTEFWDKLEMFDEDVIRTIKEQIVNYAKTETSNIKIRLLISTSIIREEELLMRNIRRKFNYDYVYEFMKKNGLKDMTFRDGIKIRRYNDRMDVIINDGEVMDFKVYSKIMNCFANVIE